MLQDIILEGFQAHHYLNVGVDPHVTTIVGPSDVGKSAVIRALIWLATNRPLGEAFIKDGEKKAVVTLKVDGHEIIRSKARGAGNVYKLDGRDFEAFGNEVPPEVAELLNLSTVNFQSQHDSPFWFCETAGEVSRQLNKIVNLEIIDATLANLDKVNRDARAHLKVLEQQLEEAKTSRSDLSWAKKADIDLVAVETYHQTWQDGHSRHQRLADIVGAVGRYEQDLKMARACAGLAESVVKVGEAWKDKATQAGRLRRLIDDMTAQQVILDRPIPNVDPLIQLKNTIKEADARAARLESMLRDIQNARQQLDTARTEADKAHRMFEKEMGDVCLLCGKKL